MYTFIHTSTHKVTSTPFFVIMKRKGYDVKVQMGLVD